MRDPGHRAMIDPRDTPGPADLLGADSAAAMPDMPDQATIDAAARHLEAGNLVAFPTETVYGLGADAQNPAAVAKIYQAKGRPSGHPLIVHLAPEADIGYWSDDVGADARKLMAAFWPGPLTLILHRAARIPDAAAGGQASLGLRCPSHPVAQALLRSFKAGRGGVAAPSANRFGQVSPTLARHVRDEFAGSALVDCILDGGQSTVGIESTILDLSRGRPVLLRPGHVSTADIAAVLGMMPAPPDEAAPRASGTLASHYAPHTPVAVLPAAAIADCLLHLAQAGRRAALAHHSTLEQLGIADSAERVGAAAAMPENAVSTAPTMLARACLPPEPHGYAHDFYAALRRLDQAGGDVILVEGLPQTPAWQPVNDRLSRAAFGSTTVLARLLG
jgi:L-threonylcarbamoyladenylate synthase